MAKKTVAREYAVIKLQGRSNEIEPEMVPVVVNGERIRMKRDEFLPVKAGVVEALRHAVRPVAQTVNKASGGAIRRRKVSSMIQRFPFELVGWIDKDKYDYMRKIVLSRSMTESEAYAVIDGDVDLSGEGQAA